ncbi:MAG TPA: lectin-like protein, partial [Polyangiales bacterium]|nr:lectin-like protein [Polyangiales bacterium]
AGRAHTCVNTLDGLVQCWGDNALRQLGNGGAGSTTLPGAVAAIEGVAQLAGTEDHACAVTRNGSLHCWGDNSHGQLGNGATATPDAPVPAQPGGTAGVSFGSQRLDAGSAQTCGSIGARPEAGCKLRLRSGRAYSVCDDQERTWAGAAQACDAIGMELAKIDATGENAFIAGQLDSGDRAWIGAKRESANSDWLDVTSAIDFETLSGDRIWHTRATTRCTRWEFGVCVEHEDSVRGSFQSPAASDLVSSEPWSLSSTWTSWLDPSPVAGENCVTLSSGGKWETQPCTSSAPFDGRGGRFAAPLFAGGAERPYVCEERTRYTDVTLDPGDYYVMVKGVDDGVVGNACAGAYELKLTDVGALGGGRFLACNDDGEPSTNDAMIETTLEAGEYYVTLKGWRAGDEGDYRLTVRDLDAVTADELACDDGSGSADPALVNFTAQPNTRYYAVVKGKQPGDEGPFSFTVRDTSAVSGSSALACDSGSSASGNPELTLPLETGTYYAVLKGSAPGASGDYQLSVGGASPISSTFEPAGYDATVAALGAAGIRVASVLSCAGQPDCDDALAQAEQLATDTQGVARMAATPDAVPLEIVRAVEQLERADSVTGSLVFSPDPDPGFTPVQVTALADPGNRCAAGTSGASFSDCLPGALPSFVVSLHNPALTPVPFSTRPSGAYEFTLHVDSTRNGVVVGTYDLPVTVLPTGSPPADTYTSGHYFQDVEGKLCKIANRPPRPGVRPMPGKQVQDERPSWDALRFDADVRPDTQLDLLVCTANSADDLRACNGGAGMASGRRRALRITAGTGTGTPCNVTTQSVDCPNGYCSPYTRVCNYLEGADCLVDTDCPGTETGRCRNGPSGGTLGSTCAVLDLQANPASALDGDNLRPFMRVEAQLTALGDGSRTPSLFFWEAWYRCRMVE